MKFNIHDIVEVIFNDRDYSPSAEVGMTGEVVDCFKENDNRTNEIEWHWGIKFLEKTISGKSLWEYYGPYFVREKHLRLYNPVPEGDDWI